MRVVASLFLVSGKRAGTVTTCGWKRGKKPRRVLERKIGEKRNKNALQGGKRKEKGKDYRLILQPTPNECPKEEGKADREQNTTSAEKGMKFENPVYWNGKKRKTCLPV